MSTAELLALPRDRESLFFCPTENCCYVCGKFEPQLLEEGSAIGKLCESCALGFAY